MDSSIIIIIGVAVRVLSLGFAFWMRRDLKKFKDSGIVVDRSVYSIIFLGLSIFFQSVLGSPEEYELQAQSSDMFTSQILPIVHELIYVIFSARVYFAFRKWILREASLPLARRLVLPERLGNALFWILFVISLALFGTI